MAWFMLAKRTRIIATSTTSKIARVQQQAGATRIMNQVEACSLCKRNRQQSACGIAELYNHAISLTKRYCERGEATVRGSVSRPLLFPIAALFESISFYLGVYVNPVPLTSPGLNQATACRQDATLPISL